MVRFSQENNHLEICGEKEWQPYHDDWKRYVDDLVGDRLECCKRRVDGLVGQWRMDEQTGNEVADNSGFENHGTAINVDPVLSKFSRGRYFNSDGYIRIPSSDLLNFGVSSFSLSGWQKILSVTYPLTTFAVTKGKRCYRDSDGEPGWDLGHPYRDNGLDVCIRDNENKARGTIAFDDGYSPPQLLGQWVHYVVVFDRTVHKVFVYVNGTKQSNWLDISLVKGSTNNANNLEFGTLYGWKTKGTLDDYRVYSKALDANDVKLIYNNIV